MFALFQRAIARVRVQVLSGFGRGRFYSRAVQSGGGAPRSMQTVPGRGARRVCGAHRAVRLRFLFEGRFNCLTEISRKNGNLVTF